MTNFTIIDNSIITSDISNTAYRVYCFLESLCYGDKNSCFPGQAYISEKLHICIRTVQRALKELKEAKLIRTVRRGSISNMYYVLKKVARKNVSTIKDTIEKVKNNYYKSKKDNFNEFKQWKYNFKNLEDMLLGKVEYDPEKLIE